MKILLVDNFHYFRGGAQSVYLNTARILREHGHEVRCFSQLHKDNIPSGDEEYFFDPGFNKITHTLKYFYNPDVAVKLRRLLKIFKPDIVHVHLMWGCTAPALFKVLKEYHIPLVHTVHDYRMVCPGYLFKNGKGAVCEDCKSGQYMKCIKNRCCKGNFLGSVLMTAEMYIRQHFYNPVKNINGLIFVSNFSKKIHLSHDSSLGNIQSTVIYNCSQRRQIVDPKLRGDYFLYYGRLSSEKGTDTLVKAFSLLPEYKLLVVGSGPEDQILRKIAPDNVEFLGFRTGKELFDIVSRAKFAIVPSNCYENNPMTIIEAYSLGVPVIGRKIGGIPEILIDGNTGLFFDSNNYSELAAVIEKASGIENVEYSRMCCNAYQFYESNFSEEIYYDSLIDFYWKIIEAN